MLDRKAALNLLDWGEDGKLPEPLTNVEQKAILLPLSKILQQSGINVIFNNGKITVRSLRCSKELVVYPAIWAAPHKAETIFLRDAQIKYAKPVAIKTIEDCL